MMTDEKELLVLEKDAEVILNDKNKTSELLNKASKKMANNSEKLSEVKDKLLLLMDIVKSYRDGSYRKIPTKSILMIIATFIYFVNPFDLVPDFIFGLGFLDDAAIIGLTFKQISNDIDQFNKWKKEQNVEE